MLIICEIIHTSEIISYKMNNKNRSGNIIFNKNSLFAIKIVQGSKNASGLNAAPQKSLTLTIFND